jgi:hypothetical protein
MDQWDFRMDQVGFQFLEKCAQDEYCSNKLTHSPSYKKGNPSDWVKSIYSRVFSKEKSSCPKIVEKMDADFLKMLLGSLLMSQETRILIPAILYRLDRCNENDVLLLSDFIERTKEIIAEKPTCPSPNSIILQKHIVYSEMWGLGNITRERMQKIFDSAHFATGTVDYQLAEPEWPKYNQDQYFNKSFSTDSKVILMNGDVDPQTPQIYAEHAFQAIDAKDKKLYIIPNAPHFVLMRSPANGSDMDCGMSILLSVLRDPSKDPDISCIKNIASIDFKGTESLNKEMFGVKELFDGVYEPEVPRYVVDLYIFIGVEAATVLLGVIIISCLAYWIAHLRHKLNNINYESI